MKILFKDDDYIFYLKNKNILLDLIGNYTEDELINIKHLDDAEVLYHYKHIKSGASFVVYFEHRNKIITKIFGIYNLFDINDNYIRDYTINNLKLI